MKKIKIGLLLGALAAIAACAGIAACGEADVADHEHQYKWEDVTAPACTTQGVQKGVCEVCGEETTRQTDMLGHDFGDPVTESPASCEKPGLSVRTCRRTGCGKREEIPIASLGHAWVTVSVEKEANCTEAGSRTVRCSRCTATETQEIEPLGHNWGTLGYVEGREPTCTEAGLINAICKRCGESGQLDVEALGHDWDTENSAVVAEPTCTGEGTALMTCKRCGEEGELPIEPLGHDWETEFTIDEVPTFAASGSKSVHCTRCDETRDVTAIPKLEEDVPTEYVFRLVRNNGEKLNVSDVTIVVRDASGAEMGRGKVKGGLVKMELVPANYTVTVEDCPPGYTAQESYTVDMGTMNCVIPLTASVIPSAPPAAFRGYSVGSAMYDFTLTTIDGETLTLSELLETKSAVVLNFWYTGCTWCEVEFPGLEAAYQLYKSDIAVIAIDPMGESAAQIRSYVNAHRLTFPVVKDDSFYRYFDMNVGGTGTRGYPTTVVIDGEGAVSFLHMNALVERGDDGEYHAERLFKELFERYLPASGASTYALPYRRKPQL